MKNLGIYVLLCAIMLLFVDTQTTFTENKRNQDGYDFELWKDNDNKKMSNFHIWTLS